MHGAVGSYVGMAMSEKPGPGAPAWKMKKWLRRHPEDRAVAEEQQKPEPPGEPVHEPLPAVKATKKKAAKKKATKKATKKKAT